MTKRVILLIDDEANALELRKFVLERAGYSVLITTKGDEALQIIRSQAVDLVISDHLLIGAIGTELARRIKETSPGVPVMLLSGVNDLPEGVETPTSSYGRSLRPVGEGCYPPRRSGQEPRLKPVSGISAHFSR